MTVMFELLLLTCGKYYSSYGDKMFFFCKQEPVREYCIVMGKRPWALAAQAPKIEGGRLHGGA